ncbi:la-related protein 6A isoform X1 [Actinidia eriantha]|uniref:la-related protein 6A isoform X1 n=1 Tax=Actinidia eriantha TaxID=165200 RepID=UPI00258C5C07|nr:la-related protein 6A isoform X1 [Actinidia eriantha]
MDCDGVTTAACGIPIPIPTSPPKNPDVSPVGSSGIEDFHLEAEAETEAEADAPHPSDYQQPSHVPVLTDDLRDKIIKQVEYYFSDENLPTDKFLMKYVTKDKEGFVPITIIASFRKMKKLSQERSLIVAALRESSLLLVSLNGKKVRRLHPLPVSEVKDSTLCTVLVENLPEDCSTENMQKIFGIAGNIKNICIRDPHAVREPTKRTIAEKLLSGKLHALVEYENVEATEKAVALLNDEQDWRYGMRVKLLKRVNNHGQKKQGWRETDSEKNRNVQASDQAGDEENHSSEHLDDTHDEEDGSHPSRDKNGYKGRNRRRGKGQKYPGTNGLGHGTVSSSHGSEPSKPPPGPKMPDGTRGFTMGRGRPLAFNQN